MRFIIPVVSFLAWGAWGLNNSGDTFSSPEQRRWYLVVPLVVAGFSLIVLLLQLIRVRTVRTTAQVLAAIALLALLPYILNSGGGM